LRFPFTAQTSDNNSAFRLDALTKNTTPDIPLTCRTFAYITNSDSNNVSVIDTSTNTVLTTVGVGSFPGGVAVNPAGTRLYVTNFFPFENSVSVIDTTTNTVLTTVAVGRDPMGVAVNPAGTRVYVANFTDDGFGDVSVIDTASHTVVATVPVGIEPVAFGNFIGVVPCPSPTPTPR